MMSNFFEDQSEETLDIAETGMISNKDPFLWIKRDVGVGEEEGDGADDEEEGEDDEEDVQKFLSCTQGRQPS